MTSVENNEEIIFNTAPVIVTFRGHPEVSATDLQAWEILDTPEWTGRPGALGFAASYDPAALGRLRGRVTVEIAAGGMMDRLEATVAASYQRGGPLVFRRDTRTLSRPFAWQSSKAAADLDRRLVERLRLPETEARVTITALETGEIPAGSLTVVGMPIGHQADLAPRALEAFASADLILAEDTRAAEKALRWRGVTTPVASCHEHNERQRVPEVVRRLEQGQRLALVSDAGMPLVSDPGYHLVQAALRCGGHVTVVPGPSAVMVALILSGLPSAKFKFLGFAPRRSGERKTFLEALAGSEETAVVFESAHRIDAFLEDLRAVLPDREMALCKDLTKRTERVLRGSSARVQAEFAAGNDHDGEFTVVIAPNPAETQAGVTSEQDPGIENFIVGLLKENCPTAPIAKAWHRLTGIPRDEAYARLQILAGRVGKR